MRTLMLLAAALTLLAVSESFAEPASSLTRHVRDATVSQPSLVFEHVNVLPMSEIGAVVMDTTVIIENGRIASVGGPVPPEATRIDGTGKWLIPGLADMHVHLPSAVLPRPPKFTTEPPSIYFDTQDVMTPFIANGVTQVMNLDAVPASIGQRNEIESGMVIGPHMALAAVINGGEGRNGRIVNSPEDGRQAVRSVKAEGYDFIKTYSDLNAETFLAIVDEAKLHGMKVVGHIPEAFMGRLDEAFVANFGMVAHAEEFSKHSETFSDADIERFAKLALMNGAWLSPTMTTIEWIASQSRSLDELLALPTLKYMHPLIQSKWTVANRYNKNGTPELAAYFEKMAEFHVRLVKAFHAAGVPIVAGTDALTSGVVPGFSLHDELELLVSAGLTPEEALASATRLPSLWLGTDADRGTIEIGKRADLVLLDADPRNDIRNIRRIAGVLVGGRWHDRSELDAMLAELAVWNQQNLNDFDWREIGKK